MFLFLPPQYKYLNIEPHPLLLPLKIDFFMDWSSIGMGSPLVRTPPQSISMRERGQEINHPTIQKTQSGSEPTQMGVTQKCPSRRSYCFYFYNLMTAT